jgi:4-hydroxyacetophenone monooxygenase
VLRRRPRNWHPDPKALIVTTERNSDPGFRPAPAVPADEFRAAVDMANIPTLLMMLFQMTGEQKWLEDPYRPTRAKGLDDNDSGGLPEAVQAEIREAAFLAITAWQEGTPLAIPVPSGDLLAHMLSVSMGEEVPAEYGSVLADDLGIVADPIEEAARQVQAPDGYHAIIIGAGISGLTAAIKFGGAAIDYTVIEKHSDVGGVWLENRYPAVGVDTPSHLYSFSFAPFDWSRYFAAGEEVRQYLEWVADKFDVKRHVRFGTEVRTISYDEEKQGWHVEVRGSDGEPETLFANLVVSAVGAFNPPKIPAIPGMDTFGGPVFHTAEWPVGADLAGRRVAVVGNGASAMQVVPAIVDSVASLTIFQRSLQWAAPFEKCKVPVPGPVRLLFRTVPLYQTWYRLRLSWIYMDRVHPSLQKDPAWKHPERSLNPINEAHRRYLVRYIESELRDHPHLAAKVIPQYPPYGKRMLLDNGWYRALARDNVELVTNAITAIRPGQIVTEDGAEHNVDVIILATGFEASRFLSTIEVRGRSGQRLADVWHGDDGRAYLGLAVPGFPNFFMLYGPNAQIGHGGSLITIAEYQMHYLMSLLEQSLDAGIAALEVRPEVNDEYNRRVDELHETMVWTHLGMNTYYRNSRGRVVVVNPWRVLTFWQMTRSADLGDYTIESLVHEDSHSRPTSIGGHANGLASVHRLGSRVVSARLYVSGGGWAQVSRRCVSAGSAWQTGSRTGRPCGAGGVVRRPSRFMCLSIAAPASPRRRVPLPWRPSTSSPGAGGASGAPRIPSRACALCRARAAWMRAPTAARCGLLAPPELSPP